MGATEGYRAKSPKLTLDLVAFPVTCCLQSGIDAQITRYMLRRFLSSVTTSRNLDVIVPPLNIQGTSR